MDRVFYSAHPSTLWASTRRRGIYGNLNICYVISNSATSDANKRFDKWLNIFQGEINTLKADESLAVAEKYINDIETLPKHEVKIFGSSYKLRNRDLLRKYNIGSYIGMIALLNGDGGRASKSVYLTTSKNGLMSIPICKMNLTSLLESFWDELVITSISNMIERHFWNALAARPLHFIISDIVIYVTIISYIEVLLARYLDSKGSSKWTALKIYQILSSRFFERFWIFSSLIWLFLANLANISWYQEK